ncbi:MAG: hypothetical protein HC873_06190 [Leptolyngbyaceae cyanobacterium SL_1_1]|nr:hypothetical protein [Leptolyngbyaceae cyanobacterium RM1_1_2]NJO09308.1 hypothetical protein [Leptolyngbyaceae cyanobacterium SL_1_1]
MEKAATISYEAGIAALVGAGIVLAGFAFAGQKLMGTAAFAPRLGKYQQQWEQVHQAIAVWDLQTAKANLIPLSHSRDRCVAEFAQNLNQQLSTQGAEAFRAVNQIKRSLNDQADCKLEITPYEFSP